MLTLQQVYATVFLHIGVILVLTAYFVLARTVFPTIVTRGQERFARRPWLAALVGLGISIPWLISALIIIQVGQAVPPLPAIGVMIAMAWFLLAFLGTSSLACHIGRTTGDEQSPWKTTIRGGIVLTLTWAFPLLGWIVLLPISLATGVGCAVLGCFPTRTAIPARPRLHPTGDRLEQQLSGELAFGDGAKS